MRCRNVPVAKLGRFILIQTVVDAELHLAAVEYLGKVQIGGRIVNRVAAQNDEQVDFVTLNIIDEFFK